MTQNGTYGPQYVDELLRALSVSCSGITASPCRYLRYHLRQPLRFDELAKLQVDAGVQYPHQLSTLFSVAFAKCEFSWALRDAKEWPRTGHCDIDAYQVRHLVAEKESCQRGTVFEKQWSDKFPIMAFGSGDFLAIPTNVDIGETYYLAPGEPSESVIVFNYDIFEFLKDWFRLACIAENIISRFRDPITGRFAITGSDCQAWMRWLQSPVEKGTA